LEESGLAAGRDFHLAFSPERVDPGRTDFTLRADVRYHDPHVPVLNQHDLHSLPLEEALADADLTLIVTAHPGVDHDLVLQRARLVVDLRGVTRGTRVENVVRL
jgi:UDP-N-acetyl-D-glucosamine dehydrogenase